MIERYRRLAERIRAELVELSREVQRTQKSWQAAKSAPDPDPFIDSVALNLHGFYTGCERIFELIAEQIDENAPGGEAWHRSLLIQMSEAVPEVRPPVLRPDTASGLDELRKFRHLVRNVYVARLIPERMQPTVEALPTLWANVHADVSAFADFVDALSEADETDES